MQRFRRVGPTIGVLTALAFAVVGCAAEQPAPAPPSSATATPRPTDAVATVDGCTIVQAELDLIGELTGADGADAMQAAIRFKAIQLEARRRGLIDAVDLDAVIAEMHDVNDANEATTSQGGVVYGVPSFDVLTYLARSMSTTRSLLQADLRESGELNISDAELRARYAKGEDGLAHQPDTVVADLIRFEGSADGARAAADLASALEGGGDVAAQLQGFEDLIIEARTLEASPDTAYALGKYQTSLYQAITALLPGDVAVVSDDLGGGVVVLHGKTRSTNPDRPFETVAPELRLRAEEQLFERRIDELVAASDVQTPSPAS